MLLTLHRIFLLVLLIASFGGLIYQAPVATPWPVVAFMALAIYLPLLIFCLPVWSADSRFLMWFSFVLLFYFGGFSMQILSEPPLFYWVFARLLAAIGIFTTSMLLIKQQQRMRKHAAK
ncbi:MAG TPA: DUF2069 domain-containing protein [Alcanivoracaceae bacterium]|nr:DUF2069 domain-containing protein [Alcanivoracaceae bacterium]